MTRQITTDDRGASTIVIHIFALGILSLLIIILLGGASAYLNQQQELAAEDSLQTIGNQLASEVTQVDRLSNRGANVTLTTEYPEEVAGASYVAVIRDGSECERVSFSAEGCLVLRSTEYDVTERIPLDNRSRIRIEEQGPGQFELRPLDRSVASTGGRPTREAILIEPNLQLGVGRDVVRDSIGSGGAAGVNLPPTNVSISIAPSYPQRNQDVTFRVEADDPDGPNDQMNYSVDVNSTRNASYDLGPTTFPDITGQDSVTLPANPGYAYEDPGKYNVTLTVNDTLGQSTTVRQDVRISGMQFISMTADPTDPGGGETINLTLVNQHSEPVRIHSIYFNPDDPNIDRIEANDPDPFSNDDDEEIVIKDPADGLEEEGHLEYETWYNSAPNAGIITDTGIFVQNVDRDGDDSDQDGVELGNLSPAIGSGDTVHIELRGVRPAGSVSGSPMNMTVTYFVGNSLNTTQIRAIP